MTYKKAGNASEVPAGKMKMYNIEGIEILVANISGSFYAIANRCTHMKGNLSEGTLDGNIVSCPKHHAKYDVTTGRTVDGPKIAFIKLKGKDEPSYKVSVEGNDIMVDV